MIFVGQIAGTFSQTGGKNGRKKFAWTRLNQATKRLNYWKPKDGFHTKFNKATKKAPKPLWKRVWTGGKIGNDKLAKLNKANKQHH